jgi:hypothetical protein
MYDVILFQGIEHTPVPGYERILAVSKCGRVFSVRRGRWYSMTIGPDGYWRISTTIDGKKITPLVHRLLMLSFKPPTSDDLQVNHMDADRANKSLENLEWVTANGNTQHMINLGRHARGETSGRAKLKLSDVVQMRTLRSAGSSLREIANQFNVGIPNTSMICSGKTWKMERPQFTT